MSDVLGQAIADFYHQHAPARLWIHNTYGPKEEMPVKAYFRNYDDMPALEHTALSLCYGRVLDIGAGAGSHARWLQENKLDCTALEVSALACDVMKERGIKNITRQDIFDYHENGYDTLLLLMNGIGLCGTLPGLRIFLQKATVLLQTNGQLLFDSSEVAYVYEHHFPDLKHYYGEIAYRYEYKRKKTDWFNWLYIDRLTLASIAEEEGWRCELITEDENGQFLVRLQKI